MHPAQMWPQITRVRTPSYEKAEVSTVTLRVCQLAKCLTGSEEHGVGMNGTQNGVTESNGLMEDTTTAGRGVADIMDVT